MVSIEQNNTSIEEIMKLNLQSQKNLTLKILKEIDDSKYNDADVKKTLSEHGIQINKAIEAAKILDDLEKGQIEKMLLSLLNNANLQEILAGISVNVRGTSYSVKSVLEAFANVPKVYREEIIEDENGETIGRKMTLDDGTIVTLDATKTVSDDGKTIKISFEGEAKGFPVEMETVLVNKLETAGKLSVDNWNTKSFSHITFDLTQLLTAPVTAGTNEEIADIDSDGTVG